MKSEEAYNAIIAFLSNNVDAKILDSTYDPDNFGNFLVSFKIRGRGMSLVCDRGQVAVCNDLHGEFECLTILDSLYDSNSQDLILALYDID